VPLRRIFTHPLIARLSSSASNETGHVFSFGQKRQNGICFSGMLLHPSWFIANPFVKQAFPDAQTSNSSDGPTTPESASPPNAPPPTHKILEYISQPVVASFMAGGIAGAVSRTVVSPLERLKILFQVQSAGRDAYQMSVGKALGKMWKEEGFKGLMAGNGTNCIRIVPYSAVQYGAYNFYKPVG
jgi:hypothetical protein